MKSETTRFSFQRKKKKQILPAFESFTRYRINLRIGSMVQPININLAVLKVHPKKRLV